MNKLPKMLLLSLLVLTTLLACTQTTTTETSTTSQTTTTQTTTTQTTTTTTTTQTETTSSQTTTLPLTYQGLLVDELEGSGTEANPYRIQAIVLEEATLSYTVLPVGYQGNVMVYQGVKTSFGIFPLTSSSEYEIDFSGTTDSLIVFEASALGVLYIVIVVDDTHSTYIEVTVERKPMNVDYTQTLKVLAIGNSFSVDGMEYLYRIAKDAGIENIVLGNLYIGGASLSTHVNSYMNNLSNYTYYKNTNDQWVARPSTSMIYGILDEEWDLITIQQVSGSSGRIDTYNNQLELLISFVEDNKTNSDARIAWHMTWAYQQNSTHGDFVHYDRDQLTMYQAIINTVQSRIQNHVSIQYVIPAGTAIQNLRTSYMGDTLTVDGYHLSLIHGRYTAGLTWFKQITGMEIDLIQYAPNGVSSQDLAAIKEAVNQAIAFPYQITESTHKVKDTVDPEPTQPSLGMGLELHPEYGLGFWNSTDSHLLISGDPISKNFVSTVHRYSKTDLPNGTIIIIEPGYQYRANFWTNLEGETLGRRSDNITSSMVIVDEAWWETQQYVAFTLSVSGTPDISLLHEEVISKFRILLPYQALPMTFSSGFYNSTGSHIQVKTDPISNNFISPEKRYTKEELPVGTIITIAEGYQYRVNFWLSLEGGFTGNVRSANITTPKIVVDEAWWGTQNYVSFNVSRIGTPNISAEVELVSKQFHVWVPGERIVDLEYTLGFYNSTGSHIIVTGDPISKNFIAVNQRFSKAELPVGSILVINPGYRYRANFWKTLDGGFTGNVRTDNITTYLVVVDEAWWGEQEFVSFNISPVAGGDLTNLVEEVSNQFFIIR